MNERIKELSKQAGDYVNETYTGPVRSKTPGKIWEDGHIGWHTQFNQKFAELVVGECMRMCDVAQMGYLTHGLEKEASGAISVKHYIEEHFGVEE